MPSRNKIIELGLPTVSDTDFVLSVRPNPDSRGLTHRLLAYEAKLPPYGSQPTQHRQAIAQLLTDRTALNLRVPQIPVVVLTLNQDSSLDQQIDCSPANSPLLPFLHAMRDYTPNSPPLHLHPCLASLPRSLLIPSWATLLGPSTRSLGHHDGTHPIVLSTPNRWTREIISRFLRHHIDLAARWGDARHDQLNSTSESSADQEWVKATRATGAIRTGLEVMDYNIRYHYTQLSGFPTGPQYSVLPGQHVSPEELYGNNRLLHTFLLQAAPHCMPVFHVSAGGYTSTTITFYHEIQFRQELYDLQGRVSPQHGIVRPIRVRFEQCKKAASICCTYCWFGGHTSHVCPRNPEADIVEGDGSEAEHDSSETVMRYPQRACHFCYGFDHLETDCPVPVSARYCTLCDSEGHSSFNCDNYKAKWVPLTPLPPRPTAGPGIPTNGSKAASQSRRPNPIITQHTTWGSLYHPPRDPQADPHAPPAPFLHPSAFPPLPSAAASPYSVPPRDAVHGIPHFGAQSAPPPVSPAASTASPTQSSLASPVPSRPVPSSTDPSVSCRLDRLEAMMERLTVTLTEVVSVSKETKALQALATNQAAMLNEANARLLQLSAFLQTQDLRVLMMQAASTTSPTPPVGYPPPPPMTVSATASPHQSPTFVNNIGIPSGLFPSPAVGTTPAPYLSSACPHYPPPSSSSGASPTGTATAPSSPNGPPQTGPEGPRNSTQTAMTLQ